MQLKLISAILLLFVGFQTAFAGDSDIEKGSYMFNCKDDNSNHDVFYEITNASVSNMDYDNVSAIFDIYVENSTSGQITTYFPRHFFDFKQVSGQDISFYIIVNGHELEQKNIVDTSNSTHRILTAKIPNGNMKLEIVGGFTPETPPPHFQCIVVPEFGSLIMITMVISVIGGMTIQKIRSNPKIIE